MIKTAKMKWNEDFWLVWTWNNNARKNMLLFEASYGIVVTNDEDTNPCIRFLVLMKLCPGNWEGNHSIILVSPSFSARCLKVLPEYTSSYTWSATDPGVLNSLRIWESFWTRYDRAAAPWCEWQSAWSCGPSRIVQACCCGTSFPVWMSFSGS